MYLEKLKLDGRVAVVTGGASGIGLACVEALVEAGARLVIADASAANIEAAKPKLRALGVNAEQLDVTESAEVDAFAQRTLKQYGRIDVLVNSAGIGRQTAAEETTDEEWRQVMSVNVDGVYWCARAFGRIMLAQGGGSIVNVGSMAGDIVVRPQKNVHYNASKAAVHHMTRSLATEWADRKVRVNAVAPGFIETPMNAFALKRDVETTRMWLGNTPMGRVGQTHEIASVVLFLASEASSLMTGAIVQVDGGYTLW